MTRTHLPGRPRAARLLATAVAALAIVAFSAMPSLGAMRDESPFSNPPRPQLSVSSAGRPLFAASGMAPGTATRRTVTAVNHGAGDGTLWLTVTPEGPADARSAQLRNALRTTVTDRTGRVLASSTPAGFGSRALVRLPAGAPRRLTITVSLPPGAGTEDAGSAAAFGLVWTLRA